MSDPEKPKKSSLMDLITTEFKLERIFSVAVAMIALIISLGTLFGGYRYLVGDVNAQTKEQLDAGLATQQAQINVNTKNIEALSENQKTMLSEMHEVRKDLQELYKAQRYDRESPRLEKPIPPAPPLKEINKDGGQ